MEPQKLTEVIALCLFAVEYRRRPRRRAAWHRRLPPVKAGCKPTARAGGCRPAELPAFFVAVFCSSLSSIPFVHSCIPGPRVIGLWCFFPKSASVSEVVGLYGNVARFTACARARAVSHTRTTEALCTLSAAARTTYSSAACGARGARMLLLTPP